MPERRSVLVIGATGQQGGATARHLLKAGHQVRALVRDPDSDAARALASDGVSLVRGDLADPESLRAAMADVAGVFSVQPFAHSKEGLNAERQYGAAVADAAKQAGVAHLVYTSVDGAERGTGIGHFESKADIERHIAATGVPATILRPTFFMDNLRGFLAPPESGERVIVLPLAPTTRLQMISTGDIGAIAAYALDHPDEYIGTSLAIAADELTAPEIAATFERVTGVPTRFQEQPIADVRAVSEDGARMFEWFNEKGYAADIPALRKRFPELRTFESWLRAAASR